MKLFPFPGDRKVFFLFFFCFVFVVVVVVVVFCCMLVRMASSVASILKFESA